MATFTFLSLANFLKATRSYFFSRWKLPILFALAFVALSFLYSFTGFVFNEPTLHLHEYSLSSFVFEIGGHFLFGAVAALPLLDFELSILAGLCAVLIDSDHILGTLNLNLVNRPDHSILFVVVATVYSYLVARRYFRGTGRVRIVKVAAVIPVAILAHLSYDVLAAQLLFAGRGSSFPLFIPFSFELVPFGFWTWPAFEASALFLSLVCLLYTKGMSKTQGPPSEPNNEQVAGLIDRH